MPDTTGELTQLPDSLAGFQGPLRGRIERGRKRKGRESIRERDGNEGEGNVPHFFFYNLTTE